MIEERDKIVRRENLKSGLVCPVVDEDIKSTVFSIAILPNSFEHWELMC